MTSADLYNILHRQPFVPFRVYLKDGREYDIRQETHAAIWPDLMVIGIPSYEVPGCIPDYVARIDLDLIDRVVNLPLILASS